MIATDIKISAAFNSSRDHFIFPEFPLPINQPYEMILFQPHDICQKNPVEPSSSPLAITLFAGSGPKNIFTLGTASQIKFTSLRRQRLHPTHCTSL
jgi:hypothetical protein